MKFDVTKLTYAEIEKAMAMFKGTTYHISKLGTNVLVGIDAESIGA